MAPQAAESIMAQNAAAQREPSMEEILASIRRIIEDSDGGKPGEADIPPAANAQAPHDMESYREALRDDEDGQAVSEAAFEPAPSAAAWCRTAPCRRRGNASTDRSA